MSLRSTLIAIGLIVGVPIFPDGGLQLALATIIGLLLPHGWIGPMNLFVLMVLPPVVVIERKLQKHPRLRHIVPRIFAGYLITIIIVLIFITVGYLLPA